MTTTMVMVALLATAALLPAAAASGIDFTESDLASDVSLRALYDRWSAHYGVSRDAGEKARRFDIFCRERAVHPRLQQQGRPDLHAGAQPVRRHGRRRARNRGVLQAFLASSVVHVSAEHEDEQLPTDVDWRMRRNGGRAGCVTDVRNQVQGRFRCGSCWAFAAAAALEGLHSIVTDQLVPLSAQELVDCRGAARYWGTGRGHGGCAGGDAATAFDYVSFVPGLEPEATYPYTGRQGACKRDPWSPAYPKIDGYVRSPSSWPWTRPRSSSGATAAACSLGRAGPARTTWWRSSATGSTTTRRGIFFLFWLLFI